MASTPKLASCSQTPTGYFAVPVGSEIYLFIIKSPKGNPWREIEFFTQTALLASQLGAVFFDLEPTRLEVFDETFKLQTGVNLAGNVIRFYWNTDILGTIRTLEYDVVTQQVVTAPANLAFQGIDPFVMDARTIARPNRIYITYVNPAGGNYYRISNTLGAVWGVETEVDPDSALARRVEGAIIDFPDKLIVQVAQKRDP